MIPTIRVEIIIKCKGSPDGRVLKTYLPGEHDIPEDLARVFLEEMKVARLPDSSAFIKEKLPMPLETPEKPRRVRGKTRKRKAKT